MFWLECISPIAKGDLKWRDALLVAHRVNSNGGQVEKEGCSATPLHICLLNVKM